MPHVSASVIRALGANPGEYKTSADLLALPMFQYKVFKAQLRNPIGQPIDAYGTFRFDKGLDPVRDKDKTVFLGTVGKDYTVVPFSEGLKTIDLLMAEAPGAHYDTAGVLGKGEQVWALADLGLSLSVGEDKQEGFLMFSTSYDTSLAHDYRITLVRVICENTFRMALSGPTKASFRLKHTKNIGERLAGVQEALVGVAADIKGVEAKLKFLAGRRLTGEVAMKTFDRLFPKSEAKDGKDQTSLGSTRRANTLSEILALYESNDGDTFKDQRGTPYAWFNAITNYVDHQRGTDAGRAESALFGSGDRLKTSALDLILAESEGLPAIRSSIPVPSFSEIGLNVPLVRN